MRIAIRYSLLVICVVLVSSCAGRNAKTPDAFDESSRLSKFQQKRDIHEVVPITYPQIREWILDDSCLTICWYGITLGETTVLEAAAIAKSLPFARSVEVAKDEFSLPYLVHVPVWIEMPDGTIEDYSLTLSADAGDPDGLVLDTINLPYLADQITLGDLIQVYGSPTHVRVEKDQSAEGPYWIVLLLWMKQNKGLEAGMITEDSAMMIDDSLIFSGGYRLRVPTPADLQREWAGFVPWQGANTAGFYASQLAE